MNRGRFSEGHISTKRRYEISSTTAEGAVDESVVTEIPACPAYYPRQKIFKYSAVDHTDVGNMCFNK